MIEQNALDTSSFVTIEQGGPEPAAAPAPAIEEPAPAAEAAEPAIDEPTGEPEEGAEEGAEAGDGEPEGEPAPKPKKTAQERIDEITRARREAEREAKYWRDVAEGRVKPEGQQQEAPKAPNPDDFDMGETDPAFIKAVIAFEVKKGIDEGRQVLAQDLHMQAQERAWEAAQSVARSKFADYDAKVVDGASNWPCTPEMAQAIRTSDAGGEVAYHLASNPEEARRIAALDPFSQVRELGRIEARLESPPPAKVPAKTATSAPKPPVNQARGASGQFSVAPDTDDFAAFERTYGGRFSAN